MKVLTTTAIVALGFLLGPSFAAAGTTVTNDPIAQRWVEQSKMPSPDGEIQVIRDVAACSPVPHAVAGCYFAESRAIHVGPWLKGWLGAWMFYHELGHHFDAELLTDGDRKWMARLVYKRPDRIWDNSAVYGVTFDDADRGLNEVFAYNYAECAIGVEPRSTYGQPPFVYWARVYRHGCRKMRKIAARVAGVVPSVRQ